MDRSFNIAVGVRVRPLSASESREGKDGGWRLDTERAAVKSTDGREHVYNHVFSESTETKMVYDSMCRPIVSGCIEGYSGCIFAYGQTGSGKTYTLMGCPTSPGVTILAVSELFEKVSAITSRDFLVRAAYCEIYQERVKDLLGPGENLRIFEDPKTGPYVEGQTEAACASVEDVLELIANGEKCRSYAATRMNQTSSRSHTLFKLVIESKPIETNSPFDGCVTVKLPRSEWENNEKPVSFSILNLVDLAGSERLSKTGAEGVRAREGAKINTSLMQLGIVINELAKRCEQGTSKPSSAHVPFRASKLTRLLSNALGGNSRTAVVCCASPAASNISETRSTLHFASRCAVIVNSSSKTFVDARDSMISSYQVEIEDLKEKLRLARHICRM